MGDWCRYLQKNQSLNGESSRGLLGTGVNYSANSKTRSSIRYVWYKSSSYILQYSLLYIKIKIMLITIVYTLIVQTVKVATPISITMHLKSSQLLLIERCLTKHFNKKATYLTRYTSHWINDFLRKKKRSAVILLLFFCRNYKQVQCNVYTVQN